MENEFIDTVKTGNSLQVQHLLLNGSDPNQTDTHGETGLTWAAHLGHTSVVKDLLAAGAKVECAGQLHQATPLLLAARGGHRGIVALLSVHANLDVQDSFGATALMLALEKYEPSLKPQRRILAILSTLLHYGANINLQDNNGDTALIWAVRWKNIEAIELLLAHRADTQIRNHRGWTAGELADARGQTELAILLGG